MQVTVIGITEGNPTPKLSGFLHDDLSTALPKARQLTMPQVLARVDIRTRYIPAYVIYLTRDFARGCGQICKAWLNIIPLSLPKGA